MATRPKPQKRAKGKRPVAKRKRANPMTVVSAAEPHDRFCGAQTRGEESHPTCTRPAGWGTDHAGEGRCKLHGGLTPIRHGRYSTITREPLRKLIEQHEADPEPLNIFPELAAARALFQDFIQRYDAWAEAMLAWHESYRASSRPLSLERILALKELLDEYEVLLRESGEPTEKQEDDLRSAAETVELLAKGSGDGKPTQILDISDAYRIVAEVTKIAERIEKIRAANAISRSDFMRVMTEMGRVVEAHVRDDGTRDRIRDGWLAIRVA